MRVISMVPSWTETLIKCGVNVVGRTRYCIHPAEKISAIPVVGGTKNIDWQKVRELKPDLLLLDREENPKSMAEEARDIPYFATHITSVNEVASACAEIANLLNVKELLDVSDRWTVATSKPIVEKQIEVSGEFPGFKTWVRPPSFEIKSFIYLIWKNPWMAVSRKTFIGSVFSHLGFGTQMQDFEKTYSEIRLEDFDPTATLLLFSTEPFPFHKKIKELEALPFSSAIVDGEAYSWFGIRTLEFLEVALRSKKGGRSPNKSLFCGSRRGRSGSK